MIYETRIILTETTARVNYSVRKKQKKKKKRKKEISRTNCTQHTYPTNNYGNKDCHCRQFIPNVSTPTQFPLLR